MGLGISRKACLPENIDDPNVRNEIISSWTRENILADANNSFQFDKNATITTLSSHSLTSAACALNSFLGAKQCADKHVILEAFAGNCAGSKEMFSICPSVQRWICTDVIKYSENELPDGMSFDELHAPGAVAKYGEAANVLLLVAPPPESARLACKGMGDYYACRDFIEQTPSESTKYIVFIGELGASDGSPGMYLYMTEHPRLKLCERVMISSTMDIFGGDCEKELFAFEVCKPLS